jgi:acetyl-CoA acetyltransferase/uncharacterized OB-fold protein
VSTDAVRPLPEVTADTAPFWQGGAAGALRLRECSLCNRVHHPSYQVCRHCHVPLTGWRAVAGTGVVVGTTVNVQQWLPSFPPPCCIAVVALDDADSVRLTTNIVGVPPEEVAVGLGVRVTFEEQDGVWFPLFEPDPDRPRSLADAFVPLPEVRVRPPASPDRFEDRVVISGVGASEVGRRLMRPPISLTIDACRAAVADAGLTFDDIDGLSTYPGALLAAGGMSEGGITAVEQALGIRPTWFNSGMEIPGQAGSIIAAMLAVASGLCRHVLCFRTVWEATHAQLMRTGELPPPSRGRVAGDMAYRLPFGAASASGWIAMQASQYFARYGATRETLGEIALTARTHAWLNPEAVYREPLTMDDYLSARMVSTPFGLYDCDVPCDGAVAVIVSAADAAGDLRQPPVRVRAVGTQITENVSWDQGTMTHLPGVFGPASHLWTRTDLTVPDVDVALIYDGFSFNCLSWLEALGVCGIGEAPDYLRGGKRIALDGELPLNPHGGQLSAGRLHGYGFVREAVVQLRGQAGERQVADAEVALVAVGGGVPAGCMLLTQG